MRCPLILILKVTAGIIPALFLGCSGSSLGLAIDAGLGTAGSVAGGTMGGSGQGSGWGGAGAGGTHSGVLPSAGERADAAESASTPTGGAGGQGGVFSNTGGHRMGGSSAMGTGGISSPGGTSVVAGKTSNSSGGSSPLGGASKASGGASTASGTSSRPVPSFPARFVGNLDTRGAIRTDFFHHWDQFTPENAGKWGSVQGSGKNSFNWNSLDAMYKYTEEHNIVFKESCFIWGASPPNWINSNNIVEVATTWMKTFCERYPNTRLIDVVNEPLHMAPAYAPGLGGGGRTNWEWVANSFKIAREACPNAVLLINEYNICEYENDHQTFISQMKSIQAMGAPVDAIGCEGHDAAKIPVAKFKYFMDNIANETGLPIYITEFDIGLADDEAQRAQYADYFAMFWDDPHVKGVTVWGYIVGATWRSNTGIMNSDGGMRPAMSWLMEFLQR